jgi:hypothetical protein
MVLLIKGLTVFLLLVGAVSATDSFDAITSWMDDEVIGPNTDGLGDFAPIVPKMRRRRGVRQLQKSKDDKNEDGSGGGGAGSGTDRPTRTPIVGYGAGTVRDPNAPKYKAGKDNSGTTVWTSMNDGGGVPDGAQSTTGDYTGNYIVDRTYNTPGVPVLSAGSSCTGTDRVVTDFGNYELTESKCGILEKNPCTNPFDVDVDTKNDYRTNPSCIDGTCGGCCRDYKYLECDATGRLLNSFVPCLCSERTYGGNPFSGPTTPAIPVTAPTVPQPSPVAQPADRTGTGTGGGSINAIATSQCVTDPSARDWWGKNLGEKPNTTPANLPSGANPGECTSSTHCAGTRNSCCMPTFCLCGAGPDCLA